MITFRKLFLFFIWIFFENVTAWARIHVVFVRPLSRSPEEMWFINLGENGADSQIRPSNFISPSSRQSHWGKTSPHHLLFGKLDGKYHRHFPTERKVKKEFGIRSQIGVGFHVSIKLTGNQVNIPEWPF